MRADRVRSAVSRQPLRSGPEKASPVAPLPGEPLRPAADRLRRQRRLAALPIQRREEGRQLQAGQGDHPFHRHPQGPGPPGSLPPEPESAAMRWFSLGATTGLVLTTVLGIVMAYRLSRRPALVNAPLLAGVALPAALLLLAK